MTSIHKISDFIQNKIDILLNNIKDNLRGSYSLEWVVNDNIKHINIFSKIKDIDKRVDELTKSYTNYYSTNYVFYKLTLIKLYNKNKIKIDI